MLLFVERPIRVPVRGTAIGAVSVVAVVLACLLPGCGGPAEPEFQRAAVRGTVTLDGEPVENGTVTFYPIEGTVGPSAAQAIQQGKYELAEEDGAVVGTNRVEVRATRKTGKKIEEGPPSPPGTMVDEIVSARITEEQEVKAGENTFDFQLSLNER
jgi:hypothetical protein